MRENFVERALLVLLVSTIHFGAALKLRAGTSSVASILHHEWLRQLTLELTKGDDSNLVEQPTAQRNFRHRHAFKGVTNIFDLNDDFRAYSIHTDAFVADRIREHPDVEIVEREPYIYADPQPLHFNADSANDEVAEPWGLGRLSHQGHENTSWSYSYASEGQGQGVDVYVVDSGIFAEHREFGGRVAIGKLFVPGDETTKDLNGHGTHCAGVIAGANVGVAKLATLIPVKVLPEHGSMNSQVLINGLKWVYEQYQKRIQQADPTFRGSIVSLGIGDPSLRTLNNIANNLVLAGVHVVTAAGNEHADACTLSPGSSKPVTTVGAVDSADRFALFSNHGGCVDIQAPGIDINSASHLDKAEYFSANGTSQACPYVAGVITTLLSRMPVQGTGASGPESMTPQRLKADLIHIMTKDVIDQNTLPVNTMGGIVYNDGSRSNYADIVHRGGWP